MVERASELLSETLLALKNAGKPPTDTLECYVDKTDKTFANDFYAQLKQTLTAAGEGARASS